MTPKIKLGLTLFALGFLGVLSMLTVTVPLGELPEEIAAMPPFVVKLLTLINPTVFLVISVLVGTALYDKVNLSVPVISALLNKECEHIKPVFVQQLKYGVSLGLLAGALCVLIAYVYGYFVADELKALEKDIELTLLARFLYGGITEELLLRFGVMTLIIWIIAKLTKRLDNTAYWAAIVLSTVLFAVGHFPLAFSALSEPSALLLSYILIGNTVAGLVFGWLYWKKGLEAAIIAHAFFHVSMVFLN